MTNIILSWEARTPFFLRRLKAVMAACVLKKCTPSIGSDKILPSFDVKLVKTTFPHVTG